MLKKIIFIICLSFLYSTNVGAANFYVSTSGNDTNPGTLERPFKTIQKGLDAVSNGSRGDDLYLLKGEYMLDSGTLGSGDKFDVNFNGTDSNPTIFSAMPCDDKSQTYKDQNCVQRSSGKWYEKVTLHGGQKLPSSGWTAHNDKVWKISGIYNNNSGWEASAPSRIDRARETTTTSVGAQMILQQGQKDPLRWVKQISEMSNKEGTKFYDPVSKTLYVRLYGDQNPNNTRLDSWHGKKGASFTQFEGNMVNTKIQGFEFLLVYRLTGYAWNNKYKWQNVTIEDNVFSYPFHVFMSAVKYAVVDGVNIWDKYNSDYYDYISNWNLRNNVFYRPSREYFQMMGPGHVFEYNQVIENDTYEFTNYKGAWSTMAYMNIRDNENLTVRYNLFRGKTTGNKYNAIDVIAYEPYAMYAIKNDSNYPYRCIRGDWKIYSNMFLNFDTPPIINTQQGWCVVDKMQLKSNIFYNTNPNKGAAAEFKAPFYRSEISNNIFYNSQIEGSNVKHSSGNDLDMDSYNSSLTIKNNIFSNCISNSAFNNDFKTLKTVTYSNNLFNSCQTYGAGAFTGDPKFNNIGNFDFRYKAGSVAIEKSVGVENYSLTGNIPAYLRWWDIIDGEIPDVVPTPTIDEPTPTPSINLDYDLNEDGSVDMLDIITLIRYVFGG